MKKILALILCALMLLGGAVAETAENAWRITVDEIVTTLADGQILPLNPALEIFVGQDSAGAMAQIAVKLNGENAAALQLEYVGDTITASADGANDVLVINDAEMFFNQYEMTGEDVRGMLGVFFDAMPALGETLSTAEDAPGMTVEMLAENSARITIDLEDYFFSLRLTWEAVPAKPFDLSGKNPVRYTFREMFPGDGTDIPDALSASLMNLMADESVQKYFSVLSEMFAFSEQMM